jgi:putative ABC transport system ATP-binding protein
MKEINGNFKTTFIFSTHDVRVMAMADRVVSIEDGQLTKEEIRDEKKHVTQMRGVTPTKIG